MRALALLPLLAAAAAAQPIPTLDPYAAYPVVSSILARTLGDAPRAGAAGRSPWVSADGSCVVRVEQEGELITVSLELNGRALPRYAGKAVFRPSAPAKPAGPAGRDVVTPSHVRVGRNASYVEEGEASEYGMRLTTLFFHDGLLSDVRQEAEGWSYAPPGSPPARPTLRKDSFDCLGLRR